VALELRLPKMYRKQFAAVNDPRRISVIEASTKAGKTAGCMMWILQLAWNDKTPHHAYWWVAPVYNQSRIAFDRMKSWLRQADCSKAVWKANDSEQTIVLPNDSKIWFKSADNPDNLYGEDVCAAVLDEATRMKEDAWHAVRSTLTATRGPVRIIGNVRGRKNWVHALAVKAMANPQGEIGYHKLTAWDAVEGKVIKREEVEAAERDLPRAVFRELYLAEPTDDGGNPFGMDAIAGCVQPMQAGTVAVWGVDLAKSQDWTVALGLDANGNVVALERWQGQWGETRSRLLTMIGDTPALVDSTGVGDPIVEDLQRQLPQVEGFRFTAGSKQQIMEGLAASIQQRRITFPDNWLRAELESFGYEHSRTGVRYGAPPGLHDDGVCALALAVQHLSYTTMNTLDIRII
jgi:hypothetical protein